MSTVHLIISNGTAEMRLDNPSKLNALTVEMLDALETHCATIEHDPTVRCVLLTATGDRAFCVGADITAWAPLPPQDFARHWIRRGHRVFDRLARLAMPTIAVLNGHAFGGGLELAITCDLRVMAPKATLALPETGVGIVPGWSGSQRLARLMPPAILKELALLGRRLSADRALSLGLINAVSDDPLATAKTMAQEIGSKSPYATEIAKLQINAALGEDTAAIIEALGGAVMAGSADKAEGVAAFTGKRPPRFGKPQ